MIEDSIKCNILDVVFVFVNVFCIFFKVDDFVEDFIDFNVMKFFIKLLILGGV